MTDLIKLLEETIEKIEELKDFKIRSRNFSTNVEAEAFKNIEIGIINSISNANEYQKVQILNNFKFRYYTEFNNKDILLSKLRDNQLNKILK